MNIGKIAKPIDADKHFRDQYYYGWTKDTPTEGGFYWCCQNGHIRIVKVWKCNGSSDTRLFTNEDGGASVADRSLYGEATWWMGPIVVPEMPNGV